MKEKNKTVNIYSRLAEDDYALLVEAQKASGLSKTEIIRRAVRAYLSVRAIEGPKGRWSKKAMCGSAKVKEKPAKKKKATK